MSSIDNLRPDFDNLSVGEFERSVISAHADLVAHPEREAKAALLRSLTTLMYIVTFVALLMAPALCLLLWRLASDVL